MPTVDLTRIGSNIGAMYSLQSLLDINNKLAAAQSKLSTGKRINSAADDPAGLVIATKMHTRSEGLKVAMDNISDAKNMLSVAESGLSKLTDIITQMRTKATQAASDTLGVTERATIQSQLSSFAEQIDDIINETKWNGVKLLDGSALKTFQTGVDQNETTSWQLSSKHDADTLGVSSKITTATATNTSGNKMVANADAVKVTGSEFATGTYKFAVLNVATDSTTGSLVKTSGAITSASGISVSLSAGAQSSGSYAEIGNGAHNFTFVTGASVVGGEAYLTLDVKDNGTSISGGAYIVGSKDQTSGSVKISDMITAGSYSANLVTTGGSDLGIKFTMTGITSSSFWSIGSSGSSMGSLSGEYAFDYIQKNTAKVQFQNADGVAISVSGGSEIYATAGKALDTGKGVQVTLGAVTDLKKDTSETFTYEKVNKHSVDVSTAAKAGAYMTTLDSALDLVNSSMADLGSLMARMDIKAIVASSAQINVESAYNRIMNANMAEEQVNASKFQVLQQTAVAMLAQSNQAPQAILSLFK